MRLVCPSCSVAYEVPDSLVPAGRVVRCARCAGEWTPVAVQEIAAEEPEQAPPPVAREPGPLPALTAMDRLTAHPAMSRPDRMLQAAWGLSVVLIVVAIGAGYVWRGAVMHAWPPSERMYGMLGMGVAAKAP